LNEGSKKSVEEMKTYQIFSSFFLTFNWDVIYLTGKETK